MLRLKTTRYDSADYLTSEKDIAAYLDAALNAADPALVGRAIEVIARARGITQISYDCGVERVSLCKALAEEGDRELDTVLKVARSLRAFIRESNKQ